MYRLGRIHRMRRAIVLTVQLPPGEHAEIAIKRSLFDSISLQSAREARRAKSVRELLCTALSARSGSEDTLAINCRRTRISSRDIWSRQMDETRPWRDLRACCREAQGAGRFADSSAVAAEFRESRRAAVFAGGLFRPGAGRGRRAESLSGRTRLDLPRLRAWAESSSLFRRQHSWRTITPLTRAIVPSRPRKDCFSSVTRRGWSSRLLAKEFTYALRSASWRRKCFVDFTVVRMKWSATRNIVGCTRRFIEDARGLTRWRGRGVSPRLGSTLFAAGAIATGATCVFLTRKIRGAESELRERSRFALARL